MFYTKTHLYKYSRYVNKDVNEDVNEDVNK
jgi:hypothetical protein